MRVVFPLVAIFLIIMLAATHPSIVATIVALVVAFVVLRRVGRQQHR